MPEAAQGFPRVFGEYELLERLDAGTLGHLFRARHRGHGGACVLRCLPPALGKRMAGVLEEARAVAALTHPNIRRVYDAGRVGDTFFMALEPLEARTLEEHLAAGDAFDVGRGVAALAQVAHALDAAHRLGIVHGHLRPEHVWIGDDDTVRVENFGLEKLRTASMLVASGSIDRARYLAPEQASETTEPDPRSDVYAVGAMLYRLATGRFHVDGSTIHEILRQIAEGRFVPPRERVADLDPEVEAVIRRALAADPAERYSTAEALAADLERLAEGERPLAADAATPRTRRYVRRQGRTGLRVAAALIGAAGVAGGAYVATRGGAPADPPPAATGASDRAADGSPAAPTEARDDGPATRATAASALDAGDPRRAVALLSTLLQADPNDIAALRLRGRANAARGEPAAALEDLDRARTLAPDAHEPDPAADARALACWQVAMCALRASESGGPPPPPEVFAALDTALRRAGALPRPVDPIPLMARLISRLTRPGQEWISVVEAHVPALPFRELLIVWIPVAPDGHPRDASVYAASRAAYPAWAEPVAREAARCGIGLDLAGLAAGVAAAAALDPDHPAVHFARAVQESIARRPGALARGFEGWRRHRPYADGPVIFHRMLAGTLSSAGARCESTHTLLSLFRTAEPEALPDYVRSAWPEFHQRITSDTNAIRMRLPMEGSIGALQWALQHLADGAPEALRARVAEALADDPDGVYAAMLAPAAFQDPRGVCAPFADRLDPWVAVYRRVAETMLDFANAERGRRNFAGVRAWYEQAMGAANVDAVRGHGLEILARAALTIGTRTDLEQLGAALAKAGDHPRPAMRARLLVWRARVREALAHPDAASADLAAAQAAAPGLAEVALARAAFHLRTGAAEPARTLLAAVLAAEPSHPEALLMRGVEAHLRGDRVSARADYAAALAAGARVPIASALAGLAAAEAGDAAAATAHLERAIGTKAGTYPMALLVRGQLRLAAGDAAGLDDLADAAATEAADEEHDLPLRALVAPALQHLRAHGPAIAARLLDRAAAALDARMPPRAAQALEAAAELPGLESGRCAYLRARLALAWRGPAAADEARPWLEESRRLGYRPPGGFGAEPEFAGVSGLPGIPAGDASAR